MSTCCPARWPGQPGTSSTSVVARGVSAILSITSACRQARRRRPAPAGAAAASIAGIALLTPGVSVDVVAEQLPEARLIVLHEPQPANPPRRLPEVEVRDQEACRAAVLWRQRLAKDGADCRRSADGDRTADAWRARTEACGTMPLPSEGKLYLVGVMAAAAAGLVSFILLAADLHRLAIGAGGCQHSGTFGAQGLGTSPTCAESRGGSRQIKVLAEKSSLHCRFEW
jgi:hypothetical protein